MNGFDRTHTSFNNKVSLLKQVTQHSCNCNAATWFNMILAKFQLPLTQNYTAHRKKLEAAASLSPKKRQNQTPTLSTTQSASANVCHLLPPARHTLMSIRHPILREKHTRLFRPFAAGWTRCTSLHRTTRALRKPVSLRLHR